LEKKMNSFCVVCTDGDRVIQKSFFNSEKSTRTIDIALHVADAAYHFNKNEFDTFVIDLDN